jgi:hypothetical protein
MGRGQFIGAAESCHRRAMGTWRAAIASKANHPGKNPRRKAMMSRQTVLRSTFALSFAALAAGCGTMGYSSSSSVDTFTATLAGSQEVPPVNSAGSGAAEVTYDHKTNNLKWKVNYSGLSGPAVASHIHCPAGPGANAGVVVPFMAVGTSPFSGEKVITPAQYADIAAGLCYVNIHTPKNPAGEIRGQLRRK